MEEFTTPPLLFYCELTVEVRYAIGRAVFITNQTRVQATPYGHSLTIMSSIQKVRGRILDHSGPAYLVSLDRTISARGRILDWSLGLSDVTWRNWWVLDKDIEPEPSPYSIWDRILQSDD